MVEEYISDDEYPAYFSELNGLRAKIASDLPIKPGMCILDLATGGGYFAVEIARRDDSLRIMGIDIAQSDNQNARKIAVKQGIADRMKIVEMDAANMSFPNGNFDAVVNFLGLEDIHMTRGKAGVYRTFLEVNRVLRHNGHFCFVVMPPEDMETDAQKIEVALFSYICDATWLSTKAYETMLKEAGFRLVVKGEYYTGKKLTPEQAEAEIKFACSNVPKIYGIKTPPFEEVRERFGKDIEKHGLGHYSKVVLFIAQRVGEAY